MKQFFNLFIYFILACGFGCNAGYAQTSDKVIEGNSGSGVMLDTNLILNNNAEKTILPSQVSVTGGTLGRNCKPTGGNDVIMGNCSFGWLSTASGQIMKVKGRPIPNMLKGGSCAAYFSYQYATVFGAGENSFKTYVTDGTNKKSSEVVLSSTYDSSGANSGITKKTFILAYPCSNAETPEIWVEHTSSTTTIFGSDEYVLGEYNGMKAVAQGSRVLGTSKQAGAANCSYPENTSSGLTNFVALGTAGSCASPWMVTSPSGQVTAIGPTDHRQTVTNIPPGFLKVTFTGALENLAAGSCIYRLHDGTNGYDNQYIYNSGATIVSNTLQFNIPYSTHQNSLTFTLQAADDQASGCRLANSNTGLVAAWTFEWSPLTGSYSNVFPAALADASLTWTNGITIGATTTAPGKGTTITNDRIGYAFSADGARIRGEYRQTAGGSGGTGDYLFTLPAGLNFADGTTYFNTVIGAAAANIPNGIGSAMASNGTNVFEGVVVPYDATRFRLYAVSDANSKGMIGLGLISLASANISITFDFWAPMKGRVSNNGAFLGPGTVTSNDLVNSIRIEGFDFTGSASATANCTASPCTIRNPMTAGGYTVTRSGVGIFVATFTQAWRSVNDYSCSSSLKNFAGSTATMCFYQPQSATVMNIDCRAGGSQNDVAASFTCWGPR